MFTKNVARLLASMAICGTLLWTVGCSPKSENEPSAAQATSTETESSTTEATTNEPTMSEELTEAQKIHQTLGYSIGTDLLLDSYSADELKQILAGLELSAKGEKPDFVDGLQEQAFRIHSEKRNRMAQEQSAGAVSANKAAGEAYLAKIDVKEGVVKTDSGLRYEILTEGSDKFATASDSVNVHYHGTLVDGTVFDSSVDRGEPVTFPLNGVIKGFSEGLTLVGEGGKIRLYMPADIAYGDRDSGGPIGPGSTLVFEVELLKINP